MKLGLFAASIALTVLCALALPLYTVAAPPQSAGGSPDTAAPTFTRNIAPIVFEHCASCHRPGEVAPFSLLTYADVKKHAKEIASVTQSRQMPPWRPAHGFGEFVGERRLGDAQIATIQSWVKNGRLEGNSADLPPAPKFAEGWALGEPDLVVKMPQAYTVRAEGPDVFRCFVIPLNLTEDKYVEAVDFRPSNRKIVHHSLLFLDTTGHARELDAADPEPGYEATGGIGFAPTGSLGGWAPGVTPRRLPDGVGRLLRKGSDLVVQVHFHPSGREEAEQSTVGIYFRKTPPKDLLIAFDHGAHKLDIPAGDARYEISDSFVVPVDVKLSGIFPHAHLLCKEIEVTATLPDGRDMPLIWIKDWDWDWQDEYRYAQTLNIPRGTKVQMRFRYDNSTGNLRNPTTPPRRVTWGEQTADEMALVFFQVLIDRQQVEAMQAAGAVRRGGLRRLFRGDDGARGKDLPDKARKTDDQQENKPAKTE